MPCRAWEESVPVSAPENPATPTNLLAMTGPVDESFRVSKNQSYAIRIATDFEIPGRCFELFVFLWRRSLIRAIDCAE